MLSKRNELQNKMEKTDNKIKDTEKQIKETKHEITAARQRKLSDINMQQLLLQLSERLNILMNHYRKLDVDLGQLKAGLSQQQH